MLKFILSVIAIVIITLTTYVYYNKTPNTTKKHSPMLEKKVISTTEKVMDKNKTIPSPKTRENKIILEEKVGKNSKIAVSNNERIIPGANITLKDIENSDASKEEKERMLDDMVYYQGLHMNPQPTLSEEKILKMIEEDLAKGLI